MIFKQYQELALCCIFRGKSAYIGMNVSVYMCQYECVSMNVSVWMCQYECISMNVSV